MEQEPNTEGKRYDREHRTCMYIKMNMYRKEPPKEDSVILYYEIRKILVKIEDQEISFLAFMHTAIYNPDVYEEYTYQL